MSHYQSLQKTAAPTSGQAKDEFAEFEKDAPKEPAKKTPTTKPAPPAARNETNEEKVERLKKEIRSGPKNISLVVQLAEEFYKKEDYEKATLLLWKHIDKLDRKGLLLLVRAHEKRQEHADMIRALNILIGKDEKDYEAYSLMGNANSIARKSKDALESYKKAIELNSKYEPAYNGLIDLYEKREPPNLYELRILYQDMIDNIGARPVYFRKLCEINTLDGTFEPAIESCKMAISKRREECGSLRLSGACLQRHG